MNIKEILNQNNFNFKKSLGQNFITDTNLLFAIVKDAQITKDDTVLEIGCGAGTLTRQLATAAKYVTAFEIDKSLAPVLETSLSGIDNVGVEFEDFLKISDADFEKHTKNPYKVVANLPYYITTPIIFKFIESKNPPTSMTLMVQKEVALRLCAREGGKDYGALTVMVQCGYNTAYTRTVNRSLFVPQPNVDSAIIRLDLIEDKFNIADKNLFSMLVSSAFAMRRKTLANNLMKTFSLNRLDTLALLEQCGIDAAARGETLSIQKFAELSKLLGKILNQI